MKGTLYLILAFCLILGKTSFAQVTLSGSVFNASNKEAIIGATVFSPDAKIQTYTNEFGFFQLRLPKGSHRIYVQAYGFQTRIDTLVLESKILKDFPMKAYEQDLDSVEIVGERPYLKRFTGSLTLSNDDIQKVPALLGETDVLKAFQMMPGVQGGAEGSSGLNVRGGSPDQNLILLDGVPVYNAAHAFSLFSIFNPDAINSASIYKGAVPARYGGRLSSVLDINLKEGDREKFGGKAELGLISGKIMLEGPIGKPADGPAKTSFLISGRRTWLDVLAGPFQQLSNSSGSRTNFFFYDLTAKINHQFSTGNNIYLSFYSGRDRLRQINESDAFESREQSDLAWGNLTTVLRWNKLIGLNLFSKLTAYASDYDFLIDAQNRQNTSEDSLLNALRYRSGVRDYALKWDLEFKASQKHHLRLGVKASRQSFDPGAIQLQQRGGQAINLDSLERSNPVNPITASAYLEDEYYFGDRIMINLGVRGVAFWVREELYTSLQPRASLSIQLGPTTNLQFAYDQHAQFIHLLTNSRVGLPLDLWVSATDGVPPQQSWQTSVGLLGEWRGIKWQVEAYYKELDQVVAFEEGANFLDTGPQASTLQQTQAWESRVVQGVGDAYGLEVWLKKERGRFNGWLSYTLSWANRVFDDLNQGVEFPYIYDRRHNFSFLGKYELKPGIDLSLNWVFRSGQRTTLPTAQYNGPDQIGGSFPDQIQVFGPRNDYILPAFHRLDIGIAFVKDKKRFRRTWKFGVYNAYNRLNAFSANFRTNSSPPILDIVSLFPAIPSVSYQIEF